MKNLICSLLLVLLVPLASMGQLADETFNYTDGALLAPSLNASSIYFGISPTNVGTPPWAQGSSSLCDDPLIVENVALTYSGYKHSGVGKRLFCPNLAANTSNNRGYLAFTGQTGKVYYTLMLNVKELTGLSSGTSATGEYLTGFWATGNATNANYRGLLCFRLHESDAGKYQVGIRATQPMVATTWAPQLLDAATTYLIAVSYERTPNAIAKLWVNPSLAGGEPTADATSDFGAVDPVNADIGRFGIYQRGSKPICYLSGISIGTDWSTSALPVEMSSLSATSTSVGAMISWVTKSETNCYGFDIERRSIASDSHGWTKVGFVQGNGTSTHERRYEFTDNSAPSGRYAYRLKQVDNDGTSSYTGEAEVVVGAAAHAMTLDNYPNPFNPSTTITFTVEQTGPASLKVYNVLGQEVMTLFDAVAQAGWMQRVQFDASSVPSGLYIYELRTTAGSRVKSMMLVR